MKRVFMGRRETKKSLSRQRIIDVAAKLFSENGVKGTPIQTITQGADIAVGTFYNYFESKEALICFLAGEVIEDALAYVKAETKKGAKATKIFNGVMSSVSAVLSARPFLVPLLFDCNPRHFGGVLPQRLREVFSSVVRYGQEQKEFRKDVPASVAGDTLCAVFRSVFGDNVRTSLKNNLKMKTKIIFDGLSAK